MARTSKQSLTVSGGIDVQKPLVKEYIDPDAKVESFLKERLPHVAYSVPHIKPISKSKDGRSARYRVNWWRESHEDGNFIVTGDIVHSDLYEVSQTKSGMELKKL